jgi:PTH1 family peptidyl-tRNA hydrolase
MVVDELARRVEVGAWRSRYAGEFALVVLEGQRVGLLKPTTFMNASGRSVRAVVTFYKVDIQRVLVIHDELDLPFGEVRLKSGGGDAGHRGLRSVTAELGDPGYSRLRFGIGHPPDDFPGDDADFVLQAFAPPERDVLKDRIEAAADAAALVVRRGLSVAMNTTNRKTKS